MIYKSGALKLSGKEKKTKPYERERYRKIERKREKSKTIVNSIPIKIIFFKNMSI